MRFLLFVLLAACELEPPPKQQPVTASAPGAPPAQQQPQQAPPPPPPAPADAGVVAADAPAQVSDDCVQVGVHLVDVMIKISTDPSQKNALEQDRTTIVRKTAEVCTQQAWSAELRACWKAAQTSADLTACGTKLPGQAPAQTRAAEPKPLERTTPPPGGAGGGSGAVKRPEPGAQPKAPVRPKRPAAPKTP